MPQSSSNASNLVRNLPDGNLPLGFMPLGPPTPVAPGAPLPHSGGSSGANNQQPLLGTWDYSTGQHTQPRRDQREPPQPSARQQDPSRRGQPSSSASAPRQIYGAPPASQGGIYGPPSGNPYQTPGLGRPRQTDTPQSVASRPGYSLSAGMTPATPSRALPGEDGRMLLRKVPSDSSINSEFSHYDPNSHLDPAYYPATSRDDGHAAPRAGFAPATCRLEHLVVYVLCHTTDAEEVASWII